MLSKSCSHANNDKLSLRKRGQEFLHAQSTHISLWASHRQINNAIVSWTWLCKYVCLSKRLCLDSSESILPVLFCWIYAMLSWRKRQTEKPPLFSPSTHFFFFCICSLCFFILQHSGLSFILFILISASLLLQRLSVAQSNFRHNSANFLSWTHNFVEKVAFFWWSAVVLGWVRWGHTQKPKDLKNGFNIAACCCRCITARAECFQWCIALIFENRK